MMDADDDHVTSSTQPQPPAPKSAKNDDDDAKKEEAVAAAVAAANDAVQDTATELDEDEARPEATFRFTVDNFSGVNDSVLSPPCMVRNLPWKIMIMPRPSGGQGQQGQGASKSMGYFLQCNGESESSSWSCQASAELRVIAQKEGKEDFARKISHLFYAKENDWGFSHYLSWAEVMDPERGFIADDKVTFEVRVTADAPHGVSWDSKKHTGYVGLKNQGATCYMNSLLQVLYFTNVLRKSVYKMPTEADDSAKSVGLALQRVFNDLQFNDKSVGTKKLTKSFGWETLDSFMQHDAQEFLRVLLEKLEIKMKGTCVEGQISKLFEGKTMSYIRCKNVDYESQRVESFYDIQLSIKGKRDIMESFKDYVKKEMLEGENKYDAGDHGLQDAEKGILFTSLPPVLHLHLMRFQYDPATDSSVKYNDRLEFPNTLKLAEFLSPASGAAAGQENMEVDDEEGAAPAPANGPASVEDLTTYILHAVLVHSGDNHGGHYVVFINPNGDGRWCKFDDDVVSRCTENEAIRNNFGGSSEDDGNMRQSTNAYMLVYIRKSVLKEVLCPVTGNDIPGALEERLFEEKKLEAARRKEKSESHLYMSVRLLMEDNFVGHQGNDLYDPDKLTFQEIRVRKADTLREVIENLAAQVRYPPEQIRLWPMNHRTNQTHRPSLIDMESDIEKPVQDVADTINPWTVFLELGAPDEGANRQLPAFDKEQDVMLFFKYYEPAREKIHYMGHMYVAITAKVSQFLPELLKRAHLPADTKLALFEEIKPNMLERIEQFDKPLEQVLEELMDGDIIVFQREVGPDSGYRLPYCRDYFRHLFYKVEVTFVDKNQPNDPGFTLTLSQRMNYSQIAQAAAEKLEMDPSKLQLYKSSNYRDIPGHPLRCSFEGTLKDLIVYFRPKQPKKIFYQKLSIPITALENKKQIKCLWLSPEGKEQDLILYPNKSGTMADVLAEARGQVELSSPDVKLRIVEVVSNRIHGIVDLDARVESLQGRMVHFVAST